MSPPGQVANLRSPGIPPAGVSLFSQGERLKLSSVRDAVEAAAIRHRNCNSGFSAARRWTMRAIEVGLLSVDYLQCPEVALGVNL